MLFRLGMSCALILALSSCAKLTGIPGHGGGKRFSEEQRLVASSIRLSVKHIDISRLRGRNAAIVFGLISDEGGGNIVGGRASITAILTQGQVTVPTSSTRSSVEIFQVGNNSTSTTTGTSTGTQQGTSETTSENSSTSTTSSESSSTTITGELSETTSQFSTDANQSTQRDSTTNTDGTQTSETTGTNTGSQSTESTSTNTNTSEQNQTVTGSNEQAIITGSETTASGRQSETNVGITYEGLGQYQNLAVPKSDAAYLMSEIRNHFILNGVSVRSPEDPSADVFVYVSVPILGTNRSRTDFVVYNQESLRAETFIEIFAIDRNGRVIMQPQIGNFQTFYEEDYVAWSGPFNTRSGARPGKGLIGE